MRLGLGLCALSVCVASLGACDVPRPNGAYVPDSSTPSLDPNLYGFGGDNTDVGASVGGTSEDDPAQTDDPGTDAGTDMPAQVVSDPTNPLSVLQGQYLMRVDIYSTASATDPVSKLTLSLKNHVSNLMVVFLSLDESGKLVSDERLCTQSYQHHCLSNCDGWKTEVDPGFASKAVSKHYHRGFSMSESGKLQAESMVMPLGFDEDPARADLPADKSDDRVWVLGDSSQVRYGVNTHLTATLGPPSNPLVDKNLDCYVGTVQRFANTFAGQLDLAQFGGAALEQKPMLGDSSATTGQAVSATGVPTDYCNPSSLGTTKADPDQMTTVRFQRYDGVSCPVHGSDSVEAAYEFTFPGNADRPTAAQLM